MTQAKKENFIFEYKKIVDLIIINNFEKAQKLFNSDFKKKFSRLVEDKTSPLRDYLFNYLELNSYINDEHWRLFEGKKALDKIRDDIDEMMNQNLSNKEPRE